MTPVRENFLSLYSTLVMARAILIKDMPDRDFHPLSKVSTPLSKVTHQIHIGYERATHEQR